MARGAAMLLGLGALLAAACGATVELGPGATAYAPTIVTIVELPPVIDWTGPGAQQRVQRVAADSLIEVTGGRAVIADELPGTTDSDVQAALRALGEDAANTLTFSITVGLGKRLITGANPIQTFTAPKRMVVDYVARGTGNSGEKWAAAAAIDEAMDEAVRAFAPRIHTPRRPTLIVEVPPADAGNLTRKLETLQRLYPELSVAQVQALADSPERFLVIGPGQLAPLGVAQGDLLGVPGGRTDASRAALARAVARGGKPLVAVVRGGQRYILSM